MSYELPNIQHSTSNIQHPTRELLAHRHFAHHSIFIVTIIFLSVKKFCGVPLLDIGYNESQKTRKWFPYWKNSIVLKQKQKKFSWK